MKGWHVAAGAVGAGLLASAAALGGTAAWVGATASGHQFQVADVPARDVVIVFGAEVKADGTPARYTAARLDLGAELVRTGRARVVVVSGDDRPEHHHETTVMKRELVARGVPAERVVEDPGGLDTYDTCLRARDVYGVRDPILVTQTYHLPRALTACRSLGLDAVGVGDETVRTTSSFWAYGAAREVPAGLKLAKDVLLRRPPEIQDAPTDAVRVALGRP